MTNNTFKGRTYEEIYGPERAAEQRAKRKKNLNANSDAMRGKTLVEILGVEAAQKRVDATTQALRGKTYEQIHGVEEATRLRQLRSNAQEKSVGRDSGNTLYWEWRHAVYERDNSTCQCCGKLVEGKSRHAHHLVAWDLIVELRFDIDNGVTLCSSCHSSKHYGPR